MRAEGNPPREVFNSQLELRENSFFEARKSKAIKGVIRNQHHLGQMGGGS